jgi:CRP-like cAMP-binding protein
MLADLRGRRVAPDGAEAAMPARPKPSDLRARLAQLPVAAGLSAGALDTLIEGARPRALLRDTVVCREGAPADRVYVVVDGALGVEKAGGDGRVQITGFLFPGDLFGLVPGHCCTASVRALSDCTLLAHLRPAFERLCDRCPELQHRLLALASNEIAAAQDHLLTLGRRSAHERVACFLLQARGRPARDAVAAHAPGGNRRPPGPVAGDGEPDRRRAEARRHHPLRRQPAPDDSRSSGPAPAGRMGVSGPGRSRDGPR